MTNTMGYTLLACGSTGKKLALRASRKGDDTNETAQREATPRGKRRPDGEGRNALHAKRA
ncbi:hypothetical protein Aam_046_040 [Acidocella aminolytica 101 = DSM 11237]|uniref:Uncharacterized protein n=1 Tax=Acidocella aminolytica 101 = DSM 11237 TaxID=1120923 RepID=A0A0D6PHT9_9PROT|nr:hypothetical protein Aam_046_040 [Acidocella aminolytica 101 = DSM 11237]GBQ34861.1 hypothetical protein AA11237_0844 [Acidocella aminolytica 101 = DSM 11237]